MGVKDFLIKKMVQAKMKHVPKEQQDMIIALVSENPEFFKKIQAQIETKKKQGQNEQMAMMQVMRENQAEIQKLMMAWQSKQK
jgi:nicotinate-nucleotide pyrophosphorylase